MDGRTPHAEERELGDFTVLAQLLAEAQPPYPVRLNRSVVRRDGPVPRWW